MAKHDVAVPEGSAWELVKSAGDPKAKYEAGVYAVEAVPVPGFDFPVPRFFFDLPWADNDDAAVDGILAQIAAAEDIGAATEPRELPDPMDLVGVPVTILGVQAVKSDLEESRWGAYVRLTVTVDGDEPTIINTGAGQVAVTAWRLFCEGLLPASGTFVTLGSPKKGRKPPLGFRVETPL